jgi:hypothetical protein
MRITLFRCLSEIVAVGPDAAPAPGSGNGLTWSDLPLDVLLTILADAPLAELARLATLGKDLRAAYKERLKDREACIRARLAEDWPAEVTEGLSAADMAVPRDLIVSPPVSALWVVLHHA